MKTKIQFLALLLMCSSFAITSQAAGKNAGNDAQQVRVIEIKQRVEQIKSMDLSHLSQVERKDVKHELKDMNKELRQMEPYIYISAGALILIIILLILLL